MRALIITAASPSRPRGRRDADVHDLVSGLHRLPRRGGLPLDPLAAFEESTHAVAIGQQH